MNNLVKTCGLLVMVFVFFCCSADSQNGDGGDFYTDDNNGDGGDSCADETLSDSTEADFAGDPDTPPLGPLPVLVNAGFYDAIKNYLKQDDVVAKACARQEGNQETPISQDVFLVAIDCLNDIDTSQNGLKKSIGFSALQDLQTFLDQIPGNIQWIGYNTETGLTPEAERQDIDSMILAIKEFATLVHSKDKEMAWGPAQGIYGAIENSGRLGEVFEVIDSLGLQGQNVLTNLGLGELRNLVTERAALLEASNPNAELHVQLYLGNNEPAQIIEAFNDPTIRSHIDQAVVFGPGPCPSAGAIAEQTGQVLQGLIR